MWKRIIKFDNKYSISMNEWYRYKKHIVWHRVKKEQLIMMISDVLNGRAIDPQEPVSQMEKNFIVYLLLLMLQTDDQSSEMINKPNFSKLKELIIDKDIKFLKWCIDDKTKYFPDTAEVARQNIFYNNRVILRKDTKLLVRADKRLKSDIDVENILVDNWLNGDEYINFTLDIKRDEVLMNINDKLKNGNIIKGLLKIVEVIERVEKGEIYNYFEKGTFINTSDDINYKYSKYDNQIIVDSSNIFKSDPYNLKMNLINLLKERDLFKPIEQFYMYKAEDFFNEFVPKNYSGERLIEYILELGKYLKRYMKENEIDPFIIENAKLKAIRETLKSEKPRFKEIDVINRYATLCSGDINRLILFTNNGKEVDDANLLSLFETILNKTNFEDFKELNKFNLEIRNVEEIVKKHLSTTHKKVNVMSNDKRVPGGIKIDGKSFLVKDIKILYPFEHEEFEELLPTDVINLTNSHALYMPEDSTVIVAIPLHGLITLKEKVSMIDNQETVNELKRDRNAIKSLHCYEEAIKVIQKQNNIQKHEAHQKLILFISQFEKKYDESLLKLIASYTVIDEELCKKYFQKLKDTMDSHNDLCVLPLKTKDDDNGINVMITSIGRECDFDRGSVYLKRLYTDYEVINQEGAKPKTLLIPIDIGLGGGQFRKVIMNYYKSDELSKEYYSFVPGKFSEYLKVVNKIIIHSVFFTDAFEERVNKVLENISEGLGIEKPIIEIWGMKLNKIDHVFKNKLEFKDRKLIIEAFDNEKYRNIKLYTEKFSSYLTNIENEKTSNMLVGRFKSMPKSHFIPLTGEMGVFNYRKDY